MKKTLSKLTFIFLFLSFFLIGRVLFNFIEYWTAGILAIASIVLLLVCNYYERKIK